MRKVGAFIALAGLILVIAAFAFDTAPEGVHNIGLMQEQLMIFLLGGLGIVAGSIMAVMGRKSIPTNRAAEIAMGNKPALERLNVAIARWEEANRSSLSSLISKCSFSVTLSPRLRLIVAAVLIVLAVPYLIIWAGPYGGLAAAESAFAFLIPAAALLLGKTAIRSVEDEPSSITSDSAIRFLGFDCNLAVAQTVALFVMVLSIGIADIDTAWWAALISLAFVPILFGSSAKVPSIGLAAIAVFYLLYRVGIGDIGYVIESNAQFRENLLIKLIFEDVLMLLFAFMVFPQVQVIRFGKAGVGRIKGDGHITLFGSRIPVAIGSAILTLCIWRGIHAVFYMPRAFGGV